MSCISCEQSSNFTVMAVRFDGELLDYADYCRHHALELVLSRRGRQLEIRSEHLGTPLDECYRDRCDCVPAKLDRCARCTGIADVWLLAGTDEDSSNLDGGVMLCGTCAVSEVTDGTLPVEILRELREAVKREGWLLRLLQ